MDNEQPAFIAEERERDHVPGARDVAKRPGGIRTAKFQVIADGAVTVEQIAVQGFLERRVICHEKQRLVAARKLLLDIGAIYYDAGRCAMP